jgi:hypothetical protein
MNKIQFRPGPLEVPLAARADASTSPAQIVQRDLSRYYEALALALGSVTLSSNEAGALVDLLNGTLISLPTAQLLAAELEDGLEDGLAQKWEFDGPDLLARVAGWSLIQRLAVCDAVERFWAAGYTIEHTADRLVAVGLVRRP